MQGIIHLPIDIQTGFFGDSEQDQIYCAAIRNFATAIRPIPTLWVVFGNEFRLHKSPIDPAIESKLVSPLEADEHIFEKQRKNPFESPLLATHLKKMDIKTVIVTGVDTLACVADAISGVLQSGLHCAVITDLLANSEIIGKQPSGNWTRLITKYNMTAEHNELLIREMFPKQIARGHVSLFTSAEFLNSLNELPSNSKRPRFRAMVSRAYSRMKPSRDLDKMKF